MFPLTIPLQFLGIRQSKSEIISLRIDESDASAVATSTDGIDEGTYHATILKNGTGDYTITFNRKAKRTLVVLGASPIGLVDARYNIAAIDTNSLQIVWEVSGTDTDTDFHIAVQQFFKSNQN